MSYFLLRLYQEGDRIPVRSHLLQVVTTSEPPPILEEVLLEVLRMSKKRIEEDIKMLERKLGR